MGSGNRICYFEAERNRENIENTTPLSECGNPDRRGKNEQIVEVSSWPILTYFVLILQKKMPERVGLSRTAVATGGAGSDRTSSSSSSTLRPASGSLQVTVSIFQRAQGSMLKLPTLEIISHVPRHPDLKF